VRAGRTRVDNTETNGESENTNVKKTPNKTPKQEEKNTCPK